MSADSTGDVGLLRIPPGEGVWLVVSWGLAVLWYDNLVI
jgi:hypothetical protein